jgi:hypothetical protein
MKTREEAISKVQKLLSLAQSSNENEAAVAAAKAREIVSQYNIDLLSLPHQVVSTTLGIVEFEIEMEKQAGYWTSDLREHVARGFHCRTFFRYDSLFDKTTFIFIGTSLDTEIAAATFQFLKESLERLVDKKLSELQQTNPGWDEIVLKDSYLEGAAERLGERFDDEVLKIKTKERKQCQDLVVLKSKNLNSYMREKHSKVKINVFFRDDLRLCPKAYSVGYTDAENLRIES